MPGKNATIFLCDDDEDVRSALTLLLVPRGFDVVAFHGGQEMLAALAIEPQPLRAVFVMDVNNPSMDGRLLHTKLIECGYAERSPIIFLSACGSSEIAEQAISEGALAFVDKPCDGSTLLKLLHLAVELERQ